MVRPGAAGGNNLARFGRRCAGDRAQKGLGAGALRRRDAVKAASPSDIPIHFH